MELYTPLESLHIPLCVGARGRDRAVEGGEGGAGAGPGAGGPGYPLRPPGGPQLPATTAHGNHLPYLVPD